MSTLSYARFLSRKWRTAPKRSTFYIGWLVQPWNLLDRVGWVIHSTHWQMKPMIIHMVDLLRDSCMFLMSDKRSSESFLTFSLKATCGRTHWFLRQSICFSPCSKVQLSPTKENDHRSDPLETCPRFERSRRHHVPNLHWNYQVKEGSYEKHRSSNCSWNTK